MVVVRFWSVLPERRPMHLLEEPEDGAELGGGAIRAFSELVGVRRRRLAELQGDFFDQSVRDNLRWCVVQGRGHSKVAIVEFAGLITAHANTRLRRMC